MFNIQSYNQKMGKTFDVFTKELTSLRTGRANSLPILMLPKTIIDSLDIQLLSNLKKMNLSGIPEEYLIRHSEYKECVFYFGVAATLATLLSYLVLG